LGERDGTWRRSGQQAEVAQHFFGGVETIFGKRGVAIAGSAIVLSA
jgi:hypothetical protein